MSTNYAAADRPRKLPTEIRGVARKLETEAKLRP